ncbi:hypothetical protein V1281_004698 [Nitrobacteraceae bacterium AZCC 2161]
MTGYVSTFHSPTRTEEAARIGLRWQSVLTYRGSHSGLLAPRATSGVAYDPGVSDIFT